MSSAAHPSTTIEPAPGAWRDLITPASPDPVRATVFRRQMGLPEDGALILSGHQPTLWHAGILAKHLACSAGAEALGASGAWLVVDHDEIGALELPYPAMRGDTLVRASVALEPGVDTDMPIRCRRPVRVSNQPPTDAAPGIAPRIATVLDALSSHADAPSASAQVTRATGDLLAGITQSLPTAESSSISRTDLWSHIVDTIRADPGACATTFNRALEQTPHTGVAPLATRGADVELPLWRMRDCRPRERVFASSLADSDPRTLAPRALLMTGVMRLAGCDLFIHGTGGAAYDRATERWFDLWLDERLAPAVLVTADVLLPLGESPDDPEPDIARALWLRHRALHDPGVLGLDEAAGKKRELVDRLRGARHGSPERAALFQSMHALLNEYRASNRKGLDTIDARVRAARREQDRRRVALDRTWPFPLLEPASLALLKQAIDRSFRAPSVLGACCSAGAE